MFIFTTGASASQWLKLMQFAATHKLPVLAHVDDTAIDLLARMSPADLGARVAVRRSDGGRVVRRTPTVDGRAVLSPWFDMGVELSEWRAACC
jgi:hypothetical protein